MDPLQSLPNPLPGGLALLLCHCSAMASASTLVSPAPAATSPAAAPSAPAPLAQEQRRLRPEERLCNQLIALIEQGVNPWRKPWNPSRCGQHRNLLTGRPYQGSNPALLELQLALRGSDLPLWLGFHQAAAQGWHPRKGSHGCLIYRPHLLPLAPENTQDKQENQEGGSRQGNGDGDSSNTSTSAVLRFRPALVFHVADLKDAPPARRPRHHRPVADAISNALGTATPRPLPQRLAAAEQQLAAWPVPLLLAGDRAFYVPSRDQIHLPPRTAFHSPEAFLATWAHELVHSTGHRKRLNRDGITGSHPPQSQDYAREELIAELGAFLLTQRLEIGSDAANHAAYLSHWAALLGQGPRQLTSVLAAASRAANLLCPDPDRH